MRKPLLNQHLTTAPPPTNPLWCSTRSVQFFWCWTGLILVYAMRVNLSVAINPMQGEFHWSNEVKGFVLGSFFIGYIFGQIPGGWLATKYGAKWPFGIGVLMTALLTLLLPWAACAKLFCPVQSNTTTTTTTTTSTTTTSYLYSLDILRILMGLFESVTYPSLMALLSQWSPPKERGRIVALTFSGAQIGTAIAFPLAAYIASQKHPSTTMEKLFERWPGVFYCFGLVGVVWFVGWSFFVFSTPSKHPRISTRELHFIQQSQRNAKQENAEEKDDAAVHEMNEQQQEQEHTTGTIPFSIYWAFLTNSASLAIMLNHFTNNWSLYLMLTWMPSYMDKMLNFNLSSSGVLFVPYLFMALFTWSAGSFADWLINSKQWSRRATRILMQLSGNLLPAVSFVVLGFMRNDGAAFIVMIIAVSTSGFAYPGYSANCLDICPKYTGILYSLSNTIATVPGIVAPILAGAIVGSPPTFVQWQIVFAIAAGLYVMGNVVYVKYARGDVVKELNI